MLGGGASSAPSEFQRFVEAATGRLLPVFGSGFFSAPAGSFAPLDNVPVSADYTVGPGDEVVVRAWGSIDIDYSVTVDRNGQLNLPKIGTFTVAGVKASELEAQLRAQIGRLYTNFKLSISLGRLHGIKVFVVGPARLPGVFTLSSQSTLLSAVVAAGGPGPTGSMRKITLRRGGAVVSELDVYEFLVHGDKSKDLQLIAGDVVVFHPVGPRMALNGELDNAAIYELKGADQPLSALLRYAGGASVLASNSRAVLERIDPARPGAVRVVEELKLGPDGLRMPLRDGDIVTLLPISPAFANAVTLRGHVAMPLRYPFFQGMRVSNLIPSPDALISPDFYARQNVLVQALQDGVKRGPTTLFDDLNWDYAVVERLNTTDLKTEVIPFSLGKVVLQGDQVNDILLMPGDVVTVFSQKEFRVPLARQNHLVMLEGEVQTPGLYQVLPGETLRQLLTRVGGITPQAYVYGLEFSREETRQRQRENIAMAIARLEQLVATQAAREAANRREGPTAAVNGAAATAAATQAQLARLTKVQPNGRIALELSPDANSVDVLPDIPLQTGDRIVVPSRPAFVTVIGAVVNSNAYLWRQGRTAGDYLRSAGPDEAASLPNMFILRADGTISGANDSRGFFGSGNVESLAMYPGDALIVPNQLDFETWGRAFTRTLVEWTQILANFGLGAAAFKSLGY